MRGCLAGLFLVSFATVAFAQRGQTGELAGTVRDASGAVLPSVTVTASSPQLIGDTPETSTDSEGRYRFGSLLPGTYEVTVGRQGFKTFRHAGIELPPGLGLTVDFRLELAQVSEVVNVDAVVPAVDVHSSASPILLDQQLLQNLPLDRSVYGYVNLAPGVANGVAFGSSQNANLLSLDGTYGNDPDWGSPWASPNANWISQIQIISLGANAEYGEYIGARINAITRSGANRYSGLSEYWTTRPGWTGNNRGDLPPDLAQNFKPIEVLTRWDTSQQLGGPIVRDRAWFFAGFEYYKNAQRPFSFANVARTAGEPRALTLEPKSLLKLTTAPATRIRLEGYVEYDNSKSTNGNAGPLVQPEALSSGETPERMGNLRLTWTWNDRTLFEAHAGTFWSHNTIGPTAPNSLSGPPGHYDQLTGISSVNYQGFGDYMPRSNTVSATLTRNVDRFAGKSHQFKTGFEFERSSLYQASGYSGGLWYSDYNGAPDTVYIWPGDVHHTSYHRTSLFVQDTWLVTDRLTIEPGVRAGFYYGIASAVPGAQPYDNHSISPRIGAAWDLAADHRTVLRAHYGRYAAPMVTSFYDIFDYLLNASPTITAKVLGPGQFQAISRSGGPASLTGIGIDPNAKHSYTEEYVFGVERELWARLSIRAQYIRRNVKDVLGWVDRGSVWTPVSVIDPGPDGIQGTADDGGPLTVYYRDRPDQAFPVLSNPSNAWQHYNGVQVVTTRRFARGWEAQGSYTWSRTEGSYDNVFSTSAGQGELSTNGIAANPNWNLFRTGRTTNDRTHDVKVLGTYMLPYWGGVRVSGVYRYLSGTPWARVAYFGSQTSLCCLGPRVEPATHEYAATNRADLRVEKTFHAGAGSTASVYVDVFNVNNQGMTGFINLTSGPNFAVPFNWSDPRTLRIGLRFTF